MKICLALSTLCAAILSSSTPPISPLLPIPSRSTSSMSPNILHARALGDDLSSSTPPISPLLPIPSRSTHSTSPNIVHARALGDDLSSSTAPISPLLPIPSRATSSTSPNPLHAHALGDDSPLLRTQSMPCIPTKYDEELDRATRSYSSDQIVTLELQRRSFNDMWKAVAAAKGDVSKKDRTDLFHMIYNELPKDVITTPESCRGGNTNAEERLAAAAWEDGESRYSEVDHHDIQIEMVEAEETLVINQEPKTPKKK